MWFAIWSTALVILSALSPLVAVVALVFAR